MGSVLVLWGEGSLERDNGHYLKGVSALWGWGIGSGASSMGMERVGVPYVISFIF